MTDPQQGSGSLWRNGLCHMPDDAIAGWPALADIPLPPTPSFGGRFSTPEKERAVWHLLSCARQARYWAYVSWPRLVIDILRIADPREYERELKSGQLLRRFTLEPQMPQEGQTLRMFVGNTWGSKETYEVAHGVRELLASRPPRLVHVNGRFHEQTVDAYGLTRPVADLLYRKAAPSRPVPSS